MRIKRILLILFLLLLALAGGLAIFVSTSSEDLPDGIAGPKPEAVTDTMFAAVCKEAWDSTLVVQWSFRDSKHYVWNKEKHFVRVKWDDITVYLNPSDKSGRVFQETTELSGDKKNELLQKAWDSFNNDSFWLIAPLKARDSGTTRKLVDTEEGPSLLVTYSSGGTTPGDSYLWLLDESGLPYAWKMWVKIIPVGGLEFTWENYVATRTGVQIALDHKAESINVPISGVDFAMSLSDLNVSDTLLVH